MGLQRYVRAGAGALILACLLTACGSSSSTSSSASPSSASATTSATASAPADPPAHAKTIAVTIQQYAYQPATLIVAAGSRLTFTNRDATAHTATSTSPPFDTGTINPGHSASVTLTKPGTYSYICSFHPFMHAIVQVK